MATPTDTTGNGAGPRAELHHIPLSRIVVQDGFNPRGQIVEDDQLQALAASIRERGCLQSIRVRAQDNGEFMLIAGERRYRAAALASLTKIPAIVLPAGGGDEAEQLELLTDAVIENELRSDLNPLQRAEGFQAMLDCGLTVRGLAERLGGASKRTSRERRVKEHLEILRLPDELRTQVAEETIPLLAVKSLVAIAKIDGTLAATAVQMTEPRDEWDEPYSWSEIAEEGLAAAVLHSDPLPDGLFQSGRSYPLEKFTLGEKAAKNLAAYDKLAGRELEAVVITQELVETAKALGAAHEYSRSSWLIVGQDVGDSLAEDYVGRLLKALRATVKAEAADRHASDISAGSDDVSAKDSAAVDGGDQADRDEQEAKAKRAEEREQREQAARFNETLGVLALKHLAKLKPDERLLRILASVNLAGELRGIASRGARLALPGWVTLTTSAAGKAKPVYLEATDATPRASGFLADARAASDVAGRALTLIALASLADENAVANSRRSFYQLRFEGPWALQAKRDLNAVVRERIKEGLLPQLDVLLAERVVEDERAEAHELEVNDAKGRLNGLLDRAEELDPETLEAAVADAELVFGEYSIEAHTLRRRVRELASDTGEHDASTDDDAEPVTAAA
jgi:ParB/RepB/Spo0J family partition protein